MSGKLAENMNAIQARKDMFRFVRDIPYYISLDEKQDYCCGTKAFMLERLLRDLGLKTRQVICKFNWEELPIKNEILKLPHDKPEFHQYLEVWIPETKQWVAVDSTWDAGLKNTGFPVAEWDGLHHTTIAAPLVEVFSPEESKRLIKEDDWPNGPVTKQWQQRNKQFITTLNKWLAEVRSVPTV